MYDSIYMYMYFYKEKLEGRRRYFRIQIPRHKRKEK